MNIEVMGCWIDESVSDESMSGCAMPWSSCRYVCERERESKRCKT